MDVSDGDDGMNVDAKLLFDLHDSGLACVLADLTAVDRDEHIRDGYLGCTLQNRNGLTDSGAGSDNVLDDDDAVAVLWLIADQVAAFTVVLCLFAVKEVRFVDVIFSCQSAGCGGCQRNTLVSWAEHCVKVVAAVFHDALCIELAQGGNLRTGLVVAGVDKVWGESAALGFELAKTKHVSAHHKFDKFFFWENETNKQRDHYYQTITYTAFSEKKGCAVGPLVESIFSELTGSCLGFCYEEEGTVTPLWEQLWQPESMLHDIGFLQKTAISLVEKFAALFGRNLRLLEVQSLQMAMNFIQFFQDKEPFASALFSNVFFKEVYRANLQEMCLADLIALRKSEKKEETL